MNNHFKNAVIVGAGVSYATYSKQPEGVKRGHKGYVMSRGSLVEFLSCPMRWLASDGIEKKSPALRNGSLIDALALMPGTFDDLYVIAPATYTNAKGEEKDWAYQSPVCREWRDRQEANGVTVITQEELEEAETAVSRLMQDTQISEFINCSEKQVMVVAEYHDKETGLVIPVRCLTDLKPDAKHPRYGKSIGDLKTCSNGSPAAWPNVIRDHAYDCQAAIGLDLHSAAEPDIERIEFRHILQESSPPYQTGRRILSEQFVERGRAIYLSALKLYCKCLQHGFFPDFEIGDSVINGWSVSEPSAYMMDAGFEPRVNWPTSNPEPAPEENPDTPP